MKNRFVSLQDQLKNPQNPLPQSANQKFADLVKKYPGFNFDPDTGVSKFSSDVLFDSGSATIKSSATQLLRDFAKIMNEGEAKRLNILVVGHTDDKPISKASTRAQHPTNWHLSTNRANSVVVDLGKAGLGKERMGAAGYADRQRQLDSIIPSRSDLNAVDDSFKRRHGLESCRRFLMRCCRQSLFNERLRKTRNGRVEFRVFLFFRSPI